MPALPDWVTLVLGSSIGTAAVAALCIKFLKDRAASFADNLIAGRLKRQFDEQLEKVKAELSRLNEERKIEYGWLYVERAKAMLEIYSNVAHAEKASEAAMWAALRSRQLPAPPKGGREQAEEEFKKAIKCHETLKGSFEIKRLLFSDEDDAELSENLESMMDHHKEQLRRLRGIIDGDDTPIADPKEFEEATLKGYAAKANYDQTKKIIIAKFRELYGPALHPSNIKS
jgi:G3E family GTPase